MAPEESVATPTPLCRCGHEDHDHAAERDAAGVIVQRTDCMECRHQQRNCIAYVPSRKAHPAQLFGAYDPKPISDRHARGEGGQFA